MVIPCFRHHIAYNFERKKIKMKKVLSICLIAVMLVSASISAFAAPNGFVNSVSGNPTPEIEDFKPANDDCTAVLVITSYTGRRELTDNLRAMLEGAYNDIVNCNKVTDLNADLKKLVGDKGLNASDIAVSDLFDIHYTDCDYHEGHYDFEITLSAETLKNFVGLLHKNKDGQWELIKDAKLVNGGKSIKFSIDDFSPFAIVVGTSDGPNVPSTNDNARIYLYIAIMIISAASLVVVIIKSKKQSV